MLKFEKNKEYVLSGTIYIFVESVEINKNISYIFREKKSGYELKLNEKMIKSMEGKKTRKISKKPKKGKEKAKLGIYLRKDTTYRWKNENYGYCGMERHEEANFYCFYDYKNKKMIKINENDPIINEFKNGKVVKKMEKMGVEPRNEGKPRNDPKKILEKLEPYIKMGVSVSRACSHVKVSRVWVANQMKINDDFKSEIEAFKNILGVQAEKNIAAKILNGDTELSKWYLQKRLADEYAEKTINKNLNINKDLEEGIDPMLELIKENRLLEQ